MRVSLIIGAIWLVLMFAQPTGVRLEAQPRRELLTVQGRPCALVRERAKRGWTADSVQFLLHEMSRCHVDPKQLGEWVERDLKSATAARDGDRLSAVERALMTRDTVAFWQYLIRTASDPSSSTWARRRSAGRFLYQPNVMRRYRCQSVPGALWADSIPEGAVDGWRYLSPSQASRLSVEAPVAGPPDALVQRYRQIMMAILADPIGDPGLKIIAQCGDYFSVDSILAAPPRARAGRPPAPP